MRLLNALLQASGASLPDQGRLYAHFTQFVRAEVLGQLHTRAYRSARAALLLPPATGRVEALLMHILKLRRQQRQKWELAAVSLEHLRLCLQQVNVAALPSSAGSPNSPGVVVLLDLLGA